MFAGIELWMPPVEKTDQEVNLEVDGTNVLEIETRLQETGGEEEINKEIEEQHQRNFMI